eukprot:symbB.v1.2.033445.t2/scaffold4157.1/size43777/4
MAVRLSIKVLNSEEAPTILEIDPQAPLDDFYQMLPVADMTAHELVADTGNSYINMTPEHTLTTFLNMAFPDACVPEYVEEGVAFNLLMVPSEWFHTISKTTNAPVPSDEGEEEGEDGEEGNEGEEEEEQTDDHTSSSEETDVSISSEVEDGLNQWALDRLGECGNDTKAMEKLEEEFHNMSLMVRKQKRKVDKFREKRQRKKDNAIKEAEEAEQKRREKEMKERPMTVIVRFESREYRVQVLPTDRLKQVREALVFNHRGTFRSLRMVDGLTYFFQQQDMSTRSRLTLISWGIVENSVIHAVRPDGGNAVNPPAPAQGNPKDKNDKSKKDDKKGGGYNADKKDKKDKKEQDKSTASSSKDVKKAGLSMRDGTALNEKGANPFCLQLVVPRFEGYITVMYHYGKSTTGFDLLESLVEKTNVALQSENINLQYGQSDIAFYETLHSIIMPDNNKLFLKPKVNGGGFGIRKFHNKAEAMKMLKTEAKKKVSEPEVIPSNVQFPPEFQTFCNNMRDKMTEIKVLFSQNPAVMKLTLRSLSDEKLSEVKGLMSKTLKGGRSDTSEARILNVAEKIIPNIAMIEHASKEANNIYLEYQRLFLDLYVEQYGEFSNGIMKFGNPSFQKDVEAEISRREDERTLNGDVPPMVVNGATCIIC